MGVKHLEQDGIEDTYKFLSDHMDTESGHAIDSLLDDISKLCMGLIGADDLYTKVLMIFPSLNSCEDESAWEIMKRVLSLIENPERRATLQLRHFKSRPTIRTSCCQRSHCWSCKTRAHGGRSCEQNSSKLDNSIVPCPQCGISLAKGDGCSSVSCFCGWHFDWDDQKRKIDGAAAFLDAYPDDATAHCVKILTNSTESSSIQLAQAWRGVHPISVNKGLLDWWMRTYQHCPAQAATVPDHVVSKFVGRRYARDLYRQNNDRAVKRCIVEEKKALTSFFTSMFPNAHDRLQTALLLTCGRRLKKAFKSKLLEASAALWLKANHEIVEFGRSKHYEGRVRGALRLFGNTNPEKLLGLSELESTCSSFMIDASDRGLVFSDNNRVAMRPGGVSCYPAAFVSIDSLSSRVVFEVNECPLMVNYMSFGLCTTRFPSSNGDGFGKSIDSWGICDSRNSSNSGEAWVGANGNRHALMRSLQAGDRVALSLSAEGAFEVTLNDGEFHYEWTVEVEDVQRFRFGCTFANDHRVSIVDDDISPESVSHSWINSEQVNMIQQAVKGMSEVYCSKLLISDYCKNVAESFEAEVPLGEEDLINFCSQVDEALDGKPFTFHALTKKILAPFGLNLDVFHGLICWMRCNESLFDTRLSLEHIAMHGDNSAFLAAKIHYEAQNEGYSKGKEYKAAMAYLRVFSEEVDAWYVYNDELDDPILPKHNKRCKCLPRCYKKCAHPTQKRAHRTPSEEALEDDLLMFFPTLFSEELNLETP